MKASPYRDPSSVIAFLETASMDTARLIAAHELLATLVLTKRYPRVAADLESMLAPLFSSSEQEARQFRSRFRRWLGSTSWLPPEPPPETPRQTLSPWRFVWVLPLLAASVVLNRSPAPVARLSANRVSPYPVDSKLVFVALNNGVPVANAVFWYRGEPPAFSGRSGYFTLKAPENASFWLLVSHPDYEPKLVMVRMDGAPLAITLARRPWLAKKSLPETPPFLPAPIPLPAPQPLWPPLAGATALGLVAMAVGIWALVRRLRLGKSTRRLHAGVESLQLSLSLKDAFPLAETRWAAHQLRRSRSKGAMALATEPTVRRTSDRSGYFSPVYRQRVGIPAYVALIGRKGPDDQLARFQEALIEQLNSHQVRVDKFYFLDNPAVCDSRDGAAHSLDRLANRFPTQTLWVFCEPEQLRDPETGSEAAWIDTVRNCWNDGLLLLQDSTRELAPRRNGRYLLSTAEPSLAGLASWAAGEEPSDLPALTGQYPPLLRERPEIWRERSMRSVREAARLCAELRQYLGPDGYQCLTACAVYPAMFWELTLWFSFRLVTDASVRSETVRRLVSLPWFRYSYIPNWLRQRFVAGLSDSEEARIRERLNELRQVKAEVVTRPLRTIGTRRRRDYVLISFLLGWKPDRFSIKPPGRLRRGLLNLGIVWRPAMVALPAALLLASASYYGILRWEPPAPAIEVRVPNPVPPIEEPTSHDGSLDPFMARVIDVAASAIADPGDEQDPFINWCFRVAADIMRGSVPTLHPVDANTFDQQWTKAAEAPETHVLRAPLAPSTVKPGFVCASGNDKAVNRIGVIESVMPNFAVSINQANGEHVFTRKTDRVSDFTLGCIDYATSRGNRTSGPVSQAPAESSPSVNQQRPFVPPGQQHVQQETARLPGPPPSAAAPQGNSPPKDVTGAKSVPTSAQNPTTTAPLADAEHAALTITSVPSLSEIEIDGKYMGSTSSRLRLTPGSHQITIKKEGYTPWTRTIEVTANSDLAVDADLQLVAAAPAAKKTTTTKK